MGYKALDLQSSRHVLMGFNGSKIVSLGEIVLPFSAGPTIMFMLFSVVDDPSPYNIILGRAWLHMMKVVTYIYHQKARFFTNCG